MDESRLSERIFQMSVSLVASIVLSLVLNRVLSIGYSS